LKHIYNKEVISEELVEPGLREIAIQNRVERERLKNLTKMDKNDKVNFWKKYLNKFHFVIKMHDYWDLLSFINKQLGEIKEKEIILDAGCGNGTYGMWLLTNKNGFHLDSSSFSYIGLDYIHNALKEARISHNSIKLEFKNHSPMNSSYILADLERPLPFKDNYFDKISCNLVISYVKNPIDTVGELIRVLKPGGPIVITTLKPYADTSEIYRNFVEKAENEEEIEEARKLLSNAGSIKQKEIEGHFRFFSEGELITIMGKAGIKDIKVFRSFANQANVAVGIK
jgi:ubiquinone/menaquinone biosynthesis C-methylase UbiE